MESNELKMFQEKGVFLKFASSTEKFYDTLNIFRNYKITKVQTLEALITDTNPLKYSIPVVTVKVKDYILNMKKNFPLNFKFVD